MAKKKNVNTDDIIKWYMIAVVKKGSRPESIKTFAESFNFKENIFYEHFRSFIHLEQIIYKKFIVESLALLTNSEEYAQFSARNKLLSFYFTLFELLTVNRAFVLLTLKKQGISLESLKVFKKMRKVYVHYFHSLNIETFDFREKTLNKLQSKFLENAGWLQFLGILKFWLDDNSTHFEKTDILIEKSVNTGFDLINTQPIVSLIDLGKFIYKEKVKK